MTRPLILTIVWAALGVTAIAQHGGKAEPDRIKFAPDQTSKVLTGTLGYDEEMEYVFAAKAGQKATVSNPSTGLFDVRIFSEQNDVETEFDSSRIFSLTIPADGDYMLYVRKKRVRTPRRARFTITLTVK